jgi:crotonobetainyl-CoA:carnitine CoA-transferase CaiB-like acyl-CoA transferase
MPPQVEWEIRRDAGISMQFTCPQKRSVGLELEGDGHDAFLRLVEWCDVLVMNMSVEAVDELGLGYAQLCARNPGLVYMNMASFGAADGPYRTYRTWGGNLAALAGLTDLVGWPDRPPTGMPISFPDYVSALWGTTAVIAAVLRRDETGAGCEIDLAQYQVAIACIGPTVTAAALGGPEPHATGNRRPGRAPQGVYATRDENRWVAVSVADEAAWRGLGCVEGLGHLADDPRFASLEQRLAHQDELDAELAAWARTRTDWEAAEELQHSGVAAAPVMDHWDVLADHQLAARDFFRVAPSTRFGGEMTYGQAARLPDAPRLATRACPAFGEHTRAVLGGAGLSDDEIDALVAARLAHEMQEPDLHLERPYLHWIPHLARLPWPRSSIDPAAIVFERMAALRAGNPGPDPDPEGGAP